MEDTLRDGSMLRHNKLQDVLILVLMEDTLRDSERRGNETVTVCLNPCFNGRYSQSICKDADVKNFDKVLILVLMEDTLRASAKTQTLKTSTRS